MKARPRRTLFLFAPALAVALGVKPSWAAEGVTSAAFRGFPVGAGPAALGGAYTALSDDAYGLAYNPGGLAAISSPQAALQHVNHVETLTFDHLLLAVPFREVHAMGLTAQYFGTSAIDRTDEFGAKSGQYRSYYGMIGLSYGRRLGKVSMGVTGKVLQGGLDDVNAKTYAADIGTFYRPAHWVSLGAAATDIGRGLRFLDRSDPLPTAFKAGIAIRPGEAWMLSTDAVHRPQGESGIHGGLQWRPMQAFVIRAGYRTDVPRGGSGWAGASVGTGFFFENQEFSYAWLPMGRLGDTNHFSLLWRFGERRYEEE